jgi:hypothetical protein
MELATGIQILSLGILGSAATALMADFLKARRQLTSAMVTWQHERKEVLR